MSIDWQIALFILGYTGLILKIFHWMISAQIKPINEKLDNHITDTNKKIDDLKKDMKSGFQDLKDDMRAFFLKEEVNPLKSTITKNKEKV